MSSEGIVKVIVIEAQIKKRAANRDKIIAKRLNQITGKEDDLEW